MGIIMKKINEVLSENQFTKLIKVLDCNWSKIRKVLDILKEE